MTGRTDNSIVINAPIDLVWDITNDIPNWPNLFSEYASADVLSETDGVITFRLTMHPDEDGNVWSWVSERVPDESTKTVRSKRIETGPFEFMNIYWEYLPEGDGTRMRWVQEFHMKPQAPANDEGMTAYLNKNTAIQMDLIKDKIEAVATAGRPA
jgi:aromatase